MARRLDAFKCLMSCKITAAHLPPRSLAVWFSATKPHASAGTSQAITAALSPALFVIAIIIFCIKDLTREEKRTKGNKTLWKTLLPPILPFDMLNKATIYSANKTWLFTNTSYYKSGTVNITITFCVMEGLKRQRNRSRKNLKRLYEYF